jgi:hypothetical protein
MWKIARKLVLFSCGGGGEMNDYQYFMHIAILPQYPLFIINRTIYDPKVG